MSPEAMPPTKLDRRDFLKKSIAGTGSLVIGLYLPGKFEALAATPPAEPAVLNAWVRIAPEHRHTNY